MNVIAGPAGVPHKQAGKKKSLVKFGETQKTCGIAGDFFVSSSILINPVKQTAQFDGRECKLPNYSFQLLRLLAERAPAPVSFEEIEREVWGAQVTRETIKQRVRLLRNALSTIGAPDDSVEAAHSVGYRLTVEAQLAEKADPASGPQTGKPIPPFAAVAAMLGAALLLAVVLFFRSGPAEEPGPLRIAVLTELALSEPRELETAAWQDANRRIATQISKLQGVEAIATLSSDTLGAVRARDAARTLSADMIILSALIDRDAAAYMSMQLIDGASEAILWADEYQFSEDNAAKAVTHFVGNVQSAISKTEAALQNAETAPKDRSRRSAYFDALKLVETPSPDNVRAAIAKLDTLLETDPDFALARGLRARLTADLVIRNELDASAAREALKDARAAVAQEPAIAELKYALARAEIAAGDFTAALDHLHEAARYMPFVERDIKALERRLAGDDDQETTP